MSAGLVGRTLGTALAQLARGDVYLHVVLGTSAGRDFTASLCLPRRFGPACAGTAHHNHYDQHYHYADRYRQHNRYYVVEHALYAHNARRYRRGGVAMKRERELFGVLASL